MSQTKYTMYADRPVWQKVPWWVWAIGLGALVVMLLKKGGGDEYEDYLR
ncbi:MAG: hypothetical protein KC656_29210 [Myxococcales bacterium]|nr:hypothetical protein [Myxococcales bacterium]